MSTWKTWSSPIPCSPWPRRTTSRFATVRISAAPSSAATGRYLEAGRHARISTASTTPRSSGTGRLRPGSRMSWQTSGLILRRSSATTPHSRPDRPIRASRRVVVDGGPGKEFWYRIEQVHPHAQFRHVLRAVMVGCDHGTAHRLHHGQLVRHLGQQATDALDLVVEFVPQHVRLGHVVAKEGTPTDPGGRGDLVHGRLVESLFGEEPQRDQLQLARTRATRAAAAGAAAG